MVKWIITKYQHSWVDTRLLILVWTDEPIHAFLHYSLSPETYSYITSIRRGIRRLITPLWELPDQSIQEQAQNGDTLSHAFYLPGIPNLATLTFFISATQNGVEAKSVSIPIRVVHPIQGGADEVDPLDLEAALRFIPWQSNQKDAVGIHDDIWKVTGMTGSGYFAHTPSYLVLQAGNTPGSIGELFTEDIFDLALDHTLKSQLRAIVFFPIISLGFSAYLLHGSFASGSGYGFNITFHAIYGYTRSSLAREWITVLEDPQPNTIYLLEAKHIPGEKVEFWLNGTYNSYSDEDLPDTQDVGFRAYVTHPTTAWTAIAFRRFMIWKRSIWTGEWHGP